jgi:hypothetical protein
MRESTAGPPTKRDRRRFDERFDWPVMAHRLLQAIGREA